MKRFANLLNFYNFGRRVAPERGRITIQNGKIPLCRALHADPGKDVGPANEGRPTLPRLCGPLVSVERTITLGIWVMGFGDQGQPSQLFS